MTVEFDKKALVEIANEVADLPYNTVKVTIEVLEKALTEAEGDTVSIDLDQAMLNIFDGALSKAPYKVAKPLYDYLGQLLKAPGTCRIVTYTIQAN